MTMSCTPWNPRNRPRVTTNEGIPILATKNPMNRPITTPASSAMTRARIQLRLRPPGSESTTNKAIATPEVTPADRSISPRRITNTSAIASMTRVAAWVIRFAKLRSVRK